jgi:hypothetical protein
MALRRLNKGTQISCKLFNPHMDNWEYTVLSFETLLKGLYMGGSKSPEFSLTEITTLAGVCRDRLYTVSAASWYRLRYVTVLWKYVASAFYIVFL